MLPQPIIAIAVVAVLVPQVVSVQTSSISANSTISASPSTSSNSSMSSNSSTSSNSSISLSSISPSSLPTKKSPSTTGATKTPLHTTTGTSPEEKTCGSVTLLWKKAWNDTYEADKQFRNETTKKLEKLLNGVDSATYQSVKVSDLKVAEGKGGTSLKFMLCLVVKNNTAGDMEDMLEKVETFDNNSVTGLKFEMSGVTFNDWRAKEGQCKVCSGGGGGPFTIERTCTPNKGYSCRGAKTTEQSEDCVKYCSPDSTAVAKSISSFILVLGIILSFSFDF